MPSTKLTLRPKPAVVDDICGDPSHETGPDYDTEELESRSTCKEAKVLKLRADGSRYTVHASSATIRGSGKEPGPVTKELNSAATNYVPINPPKFEPALPFLDVAVRSGVVQYCCGDSEVASSRTPDQPSFWGSMIKARFATDAGIGDEAKVNYQTTRGTFKPGMVPGTEGKAKVEDEVASGTVSPIVTPAACDSGGKVGDEQSVASFVKPRFTALRWIEAHCKASEPVNTRSQMHKTRSASSKKEVPEDDDDWVDVGKERKKRTADEERWVLV